ncbi:MAG TPA: hypothetical protein VE911_02200, partial [Candidatus Nitrosopolaris sp.]|nr:hypothetical protein [Candidatus Nitrosopolaris sp.]
TVKMVRETLPDSIGISVSYPLPGTKFHDMVRSDLRAKTNWIDSSDLAMMFQGTYQSQFYRRLHQLLHADLEMRQRLAVQPGAPDASTRSAMDRLDEEWAELGRVEARYRSVSPTQIANEGAAVVPSAELG